jgi:hypothetical protein
MPVRIGLNAKLSLERHRAVGWARMPTGLMGRCGRTVARQPLSVRAVALSVALGAGMPKLHSVQLQRLAVRRER